MSNSYLDIAEKAIRHANRSLHPKEMLSIAQENGEIPDHLSGKTQYKTLAARLSTEIRLRAGKSLFYRTAANRFFLRELVKKGDDEYFAPKRQKTLHAENVLTVRDSFLQQESVIGIFDDIEDVLLMAQEAETTEYLVRKKAERRYDVKQVISYALIYRAGMLLTYRRGLFSNAADELQGKRSIGFGGHVTEQDMNLFDISGLGVVENARRELSEELVMDSCEWESLENPDRFTFLCGINTYDSDEARKHLAVALVYFCTDEFLAQKNEMSINDLRWSRISEMENNLDDFEPWSKIILDYLYSGKLKIEAR